MQEDRESELTPIQVLLGQTTEDGTLTRTSSYWTPEEFEAGRRHYINRHLRAGWKFEDGWLSKGNITTRPGFDAPGRFPGHKLFNPRTDAFAVRMDAVFVSDNRYWHEGRQVYLDRNGDITGIDPATGEAECPECGGMPWHVKVPVLGRNGKPIFPPQYTFTPCRRCVSAEEIADAKRRREAYKPVRGKA